MILVNLGCGNRTDNCGPKSSEDEIPDDARKKGTEVPRKENGVQDPAKEGDKNDQEKGVKEQEKALRKQFEQEFERLFGQGEAANTNNTNRLNHVSSLDNADTGIFSGAYDDEVEGAVADFNNLGPTTVVSKHAIRTKWVYRNKKGKRGIIVRNKARLVAQGHTQEEGIDYDEVFALVARIKAIRLFFAYASFMRFIMYQMDVKSAFLYVIIEEEVYVCQPLSFEDPQFPDKVYKVEKALYGLHQAPKA
nr:copia protein [Tanacetum cinerariifolium]